MHGGTITVAVKVFVADQAKKIYDLARQELDILLHIRHPHILRLVGVGVKPLSLHGVGVCREG